MTQQKKLTAEDHAKSLVRWTKVYLAFAVLALIHDLVRGVSGVGVTVFTISAAVHLVGSTVIRALNKEALH